MKVFHILLATVIAGVIAAPSPRISKRTNLLARHECEETPTNCDPHTDPENPEEECLFCCADAVAPLGADCHLDGVVSCDTQNNGPGLHTGSYSRASKATDSPYLEAKPSPVGAAIFLYSNISTSLHGL
ncbi:hypothetical protein TWF788_007727 [Orbilia oligospora]|uniref:Uncharacterized protein n=1 Tax=Orbilia oligospora TaxID=2813651 RepID=A0A7C8PS13_ORBOL|nr:hypothetical protein TWF788_007727 [Orbilia oligospora]